MKEADLDRVSSIERASFSTPWSRSTFRNLLFRRDADLWVATLDDSVAGYAVVWFLAEGAELGNLAVMGEWRRHGLGRRLLDQAIERARHRGASRIFLEVRTSNREAQSLYERRGFVMSGVKRRYYRAPLEDARVMSLGLTEPV